MAERATPRSRPSNRTQNSERFAPERTLGLLAAASLLLARPALAIPSPDVVIGACASAAQVLGILTVMIGSVMWGGRRRAGRSKKGAGKALTWCFRGAAAMLLLSLGANVLQYTAKLDARNQRLQRNLVRQSVENGVGVGDTNLKTLSLSDQETHPRGLTTEQVAEWIENGAPNLCDVREPEEVAMGSIAGSWHMRYPDLRLDPAGLCQAGRETLLLCYSGNRSSELAEEFSERGIPCRFMIGGYEKWVAEGRPLAGTGSGRGGDLRGLPDFTNKDRLLDTPEVEHLVRDRGALFVDVRYEQDFAADHLPGAIDLPIRKMPTAVMDEAFARQIPHDRPVIAVCYDKRSSFYALILGVRLARLGHEFLGRYTVPHEYAVAKAERDYVVAWNETQNAGLLGGVTALLKRLLAQLDGLFGHLALAIAVAVLLLRTALLPLTLRNERDQFVLKSLAPEIARLKTVTGDDKSRLARAVLALHRRNGISSGRGLCASLAQVFLFLLFFAALSAHATGNQDGFLWMHSLGDPDPAHVLPVLLGVMVVVHLHLNSVKRQVHHRLLGLAAGIALCAITVNLSAALNLYLVLNVALMMTQNRLVRRSLLRRSAGQAGAAARPMRARGVAPLRLADRVPGCGNKAIRLARMMSAGLPVPDGFVVTAPLLKSLEAEPDARRAIPAREQRRIARQWRRLGADKVAVRSSGLNEDGEDQSYAGMFESILNVTRDSFATALAEVNASLSSQRAAAYSGNAEEEGGVVVQAMVDAEFAGVLFTEHPSETGTMLVELVRGLGDALVSGTATPDGYRFGRHSGRLLSRRLPPVDLAELIELGRRVERLFGRPQDIEWCFRNGRFFLLQARDITVPASSSRFGRSSIRTFQAERRRLLEMVARSAQPNDARPAKERAPDGDQVVFAQNELSELLPRPTPLSLSLMQSMWQVGGSTDIACRALGVPYAVGEDSPPVVNSVFGALYVNQLEELRRLGRGPGMLASFRLARAADDLEQSFRQDFLPTFLLQMRLRETMDLARLDVPELVELFDEWREEFVTDTYVQAELINVAADNYVKAAERELKRHGLSPARYLAHMPQTVVNRAMSLLPSIKRGLRSASEFTELFGHRAPLDYELAAPRYGEDPALVAGLVARAHAPLAPPVTDEAPDLPPSGVLVLVVDRARKFQALKEEAKHHCLRALASLRRLLLALDGALGHRGDVFFLTLAELPRLKTTAAHAELRELVAERRHDAESFETVSVPAKLTLGDLESMTRDGECQSARNVGDAELTGMLVAGEVEVCGRARVIERPEEIATFCDGEILVARFTDPTWTPLFPRAAGVVTEVGGRLSHAAIVAREFNVTTIVGADGAVRRIRTGDMIRLGLDGRVHRVEVVAQERRKLRAPA